jgi:hypothetical protein
MHQVRAVLPVVRSPEETGLDGRIPVTLSDSLEEYVDAESVPVEIEVETELISRCLVTDDLDVSVVFKVTLSVVDVTVSVDVDELEVTGILAEVGSVLVIGIGSPVICFDIVTEYSVSAETPDFTEVLSGIEVEQVTVKVGVVDDDGPGVPDATLDAVVEILSAELEGITP